MSKKKQKRSNLVVIMYAVFILAICSVFIFQTNGLKAVKEPSSSSMATADRDASLKTSLANGTVAPKEPVYSYDIVDKSPNPRMKLGEKASISVKARNTGNQVWESSGGTPVYLGTSRPIDREPVFYKAGNRGWFSGTRVMMDKKKVKPGDIVNFTFQLTAPDKSGVYREFFTPVIDNVKWLEDKGIYWDVEVRDPSKPDETLNTTINGGPVKHINLKLDAQKLYAYENGLVKYEFTTSTGIAGMDTPTGEFQIRNKFPTQYSAPYELYMDNWMAITADGAYGIHSLPYWLLKAGGRLYEGEEHLGHKVSHGCIRLSLENSKILYDWAEVGTAVYIEN